MKNTTLVMSFGLLMVSQIGYAQQVLTYGTVLAQYTNKQTISDIPAAIKVVKEHCNNLKAQRNVYMPGMIKMLGISLGITSVVGIISSAGSALGMYIILNSPENVIKEVESLMKEEIAKIPDKHMDKELKGKFNKYIEDSPNQRGLSLLDNFKIDYLGMKCYKIKDLTSRMYLESEYNLSNNPVVRTMINLSSRAPVTIPASLIVAGLSKYVLNKAASYKNQALEDLIAQDEKMLMDLRAQKAMLS